MNLKIITTSIVASLMFSGCVSTMQRPSPPKTEVPVYAKKYAPSSLEMPMGAAVVDDSSLVIRKSGSSDGAVVTGAILLGPIGVLATHAVMQSHTENSISYIDILKNIDTSEHTYNTMSQLKKQKKLIPILKPVKHTVKGERYELRPFLYLESGESDQHEMLLILRVVQFDNTNNEKWLGQYVKHITIKEPKLLSNKTYINKKVKSAVTDTSNVFNLDMKGLLKKEDKKVAIKVKDAFLFSEGILGGNIVPTKNNKITLFQTAWGPDNIYGGIHIFESSNVEEIKPL